MPMHATTTPAVTALLSHPPVDWLILLFVFVVILIDALRSGTGRAAALSVALPLTIFVSDIAHHATILGTILAKFSTQPMQATIFGVLFCVVFFLTYRIMYAWGGAVVPPTVAIVGSLSATIIALVMWLQVPALQLVWNFGPTIQSLFGTGYAFWWLISGFLLMAFVRS